MLSSGKRVVKGVFRLLARWHWPWLAAHLANLLTHSVVSPGIPSKAGRRPYRALVLSVKNSGFLEDIEDSFRDDEAFELIVWPSYALNAFASALLPPSLDHNNYLTNDSSIEAAKRRYRDFLAATWRHYCKLRPVAVVLTGNFAYYDEREFAAALESVGTPFIALHKENVRPPRRVKEYWHWIYRERRGKFTGRKILVYNEIERDLEISSGVVEPDRVVVTGMPRLDRIHRWRQKHSGRTSSAGGPQVLFFAFSPYDKLTAIHRKPTAGLPGNVEKMDGDWGTLSWEGLCEQTHRALIEAARSYPDLRMIIKTKGQSRKLDDIMQSLDAVGESFPPNLVLVNGGDPFRLITESCAVIGFNTTGLLEAIAAGKPVIVPWFGEVRDLSRQDLIVDLGDAVLYARSPEELGEMIHQFAKAPMEVPRDLTEAASSILRYWVGNDDGAAGRRVLEAIREEVEHPWASGAGTTSRVPLEADHAAASPVSQRQ